MVRLLSVVRRQRYHTGNTLSLPLPADITQTVGAMYLHVEIDDPPDGRFGVRTSSSEVDDTRLNNSAITHLITDDASTTDNIDTLEALPIFTAVAADTEAYEVATDSGGQEGVLGWNLSGNRIIVKANGYWYRSNISLS